MHSQEAKSLFENSWPIILGQLGQAGGVSGRGKIYKKGRLVGRPGYNKIVPGFCSGPRDQKMATKLHPVKWTARSLGRALLDRLLLHLVQPLPEATRALLIIGPGHLPLQHRWKSSNQR